MSLRTTDERKLIAGKLRKHRAQTGGGPERLTKPPSAPAELSAAARVEWDWLATEGVQLGTLTASDLRALRMLAEMLAQIDDLAARVQTEGFTLQSGDTIKANPALRALESARVQAVALLKQFGMTPLSRQSVNLAPAPKADNPFANLSGSHRFANGRRI